MTDLVFDHRDGFAEGGIEVGAFGGDDGLGANKAGEAEAAQGDGAKAFQADEGVGGSEGVFEDLTDEDTQHGDLIGEPFEFVTIEIALDDALELARVEAVTQVVGIAEWGAAPFGWGRKGDHFCIGHGLPPILY